jgi:gliding motility-associated-like protein
LYSPDEYNFTWSGPNGFVSNDPEPIIENVTIDMAGEYVLIVENPDASDTASTIVEISLPPDPPVIVAQDSSICNGEFTFLNVVGTYSSYDWPSIGQSNQQVEVGPGTYEVIVDAVLGCSATASITIDVAPTIEPVIVAPDSLCGVATAAIYTTEQFDTYQWTNGSTNDTITVGPGFYAVNVTLAGFCNSSSQTVQIFESATITPVIEGPDHTCFDFIVPLQTTQEFASYEWSTGSITDTVLVNQGTFTVTVTDEFGCTGTSLPFIVTNSAPDAEVLGITDFCEGDSIFLNAPPDFVEYSWTNALFETLSTADTVWFGGDSLYLRVTDEFGCFSSELFIIPPTPLPGANFTANPSLTYIQLPEATISYADNTQNASGDTIVFWNYLVEPWDGDWIPGDGQDSVFFDTPDGSLTITYPDTGFYTVTMLAVSQLGCIDTVQYTLYVFDDPYVPNAISPNGDGINDFLKIPFLSGYPENEVYIYNRWGKRVYEATNYKDDWAAENLPSGTYFYVVTAPTLDLPLKGALNVFKEE